MLRQLSIITSLVAGPAAGEFSLEWPVDCILDETCYIQQFVDLDPSKSATDFMCGSLTYDTHKGTDIALPSLAAQRDGVAVLAAAPGLVVAVRDGMEDRIITQRDSPSIKDRECGNGVMIRHGDGWETQYCHLAKGSVTVERNMQVEAGDSLGMIGLSGRTQFPHLHLTVRHRGETVDPFNPTGARTCDTLPTDTLWQTPVATPQGGLIAIGFAPDVPAYDLIKAGQAHKETIGKDQAIVIWGYAFGVQSGDTFEVTIEGPTGEMLSETIAFERTQAQLFRAVGRRAPTTGWAPGNYLGIITHVRNGAQLDQQQITITVQ